MRTPCTTMFCDFPGTIRGVYGPKTDEPSAATYCVKCASFLWSDGSFKPDDVTRLHRAPAYATQRERDILAKFDAGKPAPESFDAVAAVQRVQRLALDLESDPEFSEEQRWVARWIRDALVGNA